MTTWKDNRKLKLLIIVGTRPEIIRLAAVINKTRKYFDVILTHTGQNYDYNLNGVFFKDLKLADPELYLNAVAKDLGETMGNIITKSYEAMVYLKPDAVLVLGDTNSCLSVIGAKRLHIPIFHMEAGNRCKDECLPEETNRRIVDIISDVNLAYSERARRYLEALVETNFRKDDLLISLSYSEENMPDGIGEAKRKFHNFIRRLNRKRKAMGMPNAKYIVVTEINAKGKAHHHVIMDAMVDRDTVEKIWGQGRANTKRIQPDTKKHLLPVINYIAKAFKETKGKPERMRRWDSSKDNLKKPWVSINDNPRMMSHKKMKLMQDLPEDSECMKKIIELDNPHYELIDVEKEYHEEMGEWHFFCRMRLFTKSTSGIVNKLVGKREKKSLSPKQEGNQCRKKIHILCCDN